MALTKATDKLSSNNLMIVLLLITLVVIGVAVMTSKSLITTIIRDGKVASKKIAAEKQLSENLKAAPLLVNDYNSLGTKDALLKDALPETVDFPSLLVTYENMGNISGVRVTAVSPAVATGETTLAPATAASVAAPQPQPYRVGVTIAGTYAGILKFLNALETSARPMRVAEVKFAGSGSSLTADINLDTYYQDKASLPFSTEIIK